MFAYKFGKFHILYYILLLLLSNRYLFADPIFIQKSRELILRGDFAGAVSYLKTWESVKLSPHEKAKLYKEEGDIYLFYLHDPSDALKAYSHSLEYAKPFSEEYLKSFFGLTQAHARKGEVKKALKILENLKSIYRGRPEIASINYMMGEIKKFKIQERGTHKPSKKKTGKPPFATIPENPPVKVKLGMIHSFRELGKINFSAITVFLPGGISDTLRSLQEINSNQFPAGTTFTIRSYRKTLSFRGKRYRGSFILKLLDNGKIEVINVLPLEDYLKGVLPWEINPRWPFEALKAQAVAARTYALYHILQKNEYDLESTVLSQVYKGASIENPATNMAIEATKGEILTYNGYPILAYFHSCDGGFREVPENVWGVSFPYFARGIDPWCMYHPQKWRYTLSLSEITTRLKRAYPFMGSVKKIIPVRDGQTVIFLLIKTSRGNIKIRTNNFRLIVGPSKIRSAIFTLRKKGNLYIFEGKGYGHGVGLSQWGAYYMARAGKNYREILQFYYPGTRITPISRIRLYFHEALTR